MCTLNVEKDCQKDLTLEKLYAILVEASKEVDKTTFAMAICMREKDLVPLDKHKILC